MIARLFASALLNTSRNTPVLDRSAGISVFARLDGNREGGAVTRAVMRRHGRQAQRLGPLLRHGGADQAARVLGHEVDLGGRRKLGGDNDITRSEEHTSELQSLMRTSYAVFCLQKKTQRTDNIMVRRDNRH